MKAKIRKTGEIVDIICYGGSPIFRSDVLDYVNYIDSQGIEHIQSNHLNYYWDFEPVEITADKPAEMTTDEHWQDIRNQAAIAAMQGVMNFFGSIDYNRNTIAKLAVEQADALIEELEKRGKSKLAEWSEEDEKIRKQVISFLKEFEHDHYRSLDFSFWIDWLKKQGQVKEKNSPYPIKAVVFSKQKPAWSEEDETRLTNIIIMLKEGASHHFIKDDITKAVDWLKSIKKRITWKPNEEQMDYLLRCAEQNNNYAGAILTSLYNDLKKLI